MAGVIGESVLVLRYTQDRRGNRVEASRHVENGCAFAPEPSTNMRGSEEDTDRSSRVIADAELYAPFGVDIRADDVIELASGDRWEAAGAPQRWRSPFAGAWQAGTVVPLRRITG